jgi:hypothetical protein
VRNVKVAKRMKGMSSGKHILIFAKDGRYLVDLGKR